MMDKDKNLKLFLIALVSIVFIIGWAMQGDTYPPPETAIKQCLDEEKVPIYQSDYSGTKFMCVPKKSTIRL